MGYCISAWLFPGANQNGGQTSGQSELGLDGAQRGPSRIQKSLAGRSHSCFVSCSVVQTREDVHVADIEVGNFWVLTSYNIIFLSVSDHMFSKQSLVRQSK